MWQVKPRSVDVLFRTIYLSRNSMTLLFAPDHKTHLQVLTISNRQVSSGANAVHVGKPLVSSAHLPSAMVGLVARAFFRASYGPLSDTFTNPRPCIDKSRYCSLRVPALVLLLSSSTCRRCELLHMSGLQASISACLIADNSPVTQELVRAVRVASSGRSVASCPGAEVSWGNCMPGSPGTR